MTKVELTEEELKLLDEALDSHIYWQLSDPEYRNDGEVRDPGSNDPDFAVAIIEAREIKDKLLFQAKKAADDGR